MLTWQATQAAGSRGGLLRENHVGGRSAPLLQVRLTPSCLPAPALIRQALQEASLLASLRHPCVVQFMGVCREPPCIITGEAAPHVLAPAFLLSAQLGTFLRLSTSTLLP